MNSVQEKAQQFIDALHALEQGSQDDVAPIVALFAEKTRITNAALQLTGKEENGLEGAMRFWSEYKKTLGDCFSTFHHVTNDDNAAGLFWTTKGVDLDGKTVQYDGVSLLEYGEDGKISFFRGYYDTRDLTVKTST